MRGYVFTKEEKKILNTYIKRGVKIRHFNVIMTLIRRNQANLEEDLKILNAVVRKIKSSSNKRGRKRRG
jgi:flagellar biosynthesis component FlhA